MPPVRDVLVDDQHAVAVARDGEERLAVERGEAAQVEHGGLDAVLRELLGDAHRDVHVRAVGDDREIGARPPQRGLADRDRRRRRRRAAPA